MTPLGIDVLRLLTWQALGVVAGLSVLVATPLGLGWGLPVVALAWTFGAWAWAVRRPAAPDRICVRAVASRVGLGWGAAIGGLYLVVASRPGQVEVEGAGLVLAALVLGALGVGASAGLSLCGIDATGRVVGDGGVQSRRR